MEKTGVTESSQYLTFNLEKERYALDISQVREVLDITGITKVPKMPAFMKGVINLRGGVVPVVDLRLKFGLTPTDSTVKTCIIIMEITIDGEATLLGALVDSVQEVMNIDPAQIEPPPKIGTSLNTEFIKGMGNKNDEFVIIVDIDKVFSLDERAMLQPHIEGEFLMQDSCDTADDNVNSEGQV